MPTITIPTETRERLRELAAREGKSIDALIQEILERTAMRADTAEELIQKLGLDKTSSPAPRRSRKKTAARKPSKKRAR